MREGEAMKYRVWDMAKSDRGIGCGTTVEAADPYEAIRADGKKKGMVVEFWTKHDPTGGRMYAAATLRDRGGKRVKVGARMVIW